MPKNGVKVVKNRVSLPSVWAFMLFFSLFTQAVYAGGRKEPNLTQADALILEKQYDEAIRILSRFAGVNPERFSEAQSRLKHIYQVRDEFNAIADMLLDELVLEHPNSEKVLQFITRLEELEDTSNPQVRDFLIRARALATFNYNRLRLERILIQGRALLDRGDYDAALRAYMSGMDIYRADFFNSGYSADIVEKVSVGITNINAVADAFAAFSAPLGAAAAELSMAVERGAAPARVGELYARLLDAMNAYISRGQLLYQTVNYYLEQLAVFQKEDPNIGDRSFLSFSARLILGRSTEQVQEGIAGVLEGYWDSTVGKTGEALKTKSLSVYADAFKFADGKQYASARQNFSTAADYARYPLNLIVKRGELKAGGRAKTESYGNQKILLDNLNDYISFESIVDAGRNLVQNSDNGIRYDAIHAGDKNSFIYWRNGSISTAEALRREVAINDSLLALGSNISAMLLQAEKKKDEQLGYQNELTERTKLEFDFSEYAEKAQYLISSLYSLVLADQLDSSIRYYSIANGDIENRLKDRQGQFAEGNRLINGVSRMVENGVVVIDHFPTECLAILNNMANALQSDIQVGNTLLVRYRAEPAAISEDRDISRLQNSAQLTVEQLSALRLQGISLASTARNQIAQAEAYRQDGARYYAEAQNALSRQNFDVARDRLELAAKQFQNSLSIQESATLKREWDTQVVALGREITRVENELVIRDVRAMVNSARAAYFEGNFERADDLLVRAQNRWHVTNPNNEPEVEYWLNLVRGAASLRSGRVIPITAPLYPEMSQLLSNAKKDYEEGVRLLGAGQRAQGIAKFTSAREKTHEVKLMFPVNQEAGMLDLRMDRVTDPRAFDLGFEQRLKDAQAGTKKKSLEAFAELQNLAEINPRYPGMAGIITQAEIDMGFRPPPPDPQDIARSNELSNSAQRILDGNITSQFEVALAQINQAILLNPNNSRATAIKDRLLTRISTPNVIVMDYQDEVAYNQALNEYQRGNYIMAFSIVQRLLQNSRYRNIAKLQELQRRIQPYL